MRLAQLDRAFGYGPKGRGFESSNARCKRSFVRKTSFLYLPSWAHIKKCPDNFHTRTHSFYFFSLFHSAFYPSATSSVVPIKGIMIPVNNSCFKLLLLLPVLKFLSEPHHCLYGCEPPSHCFFLPHQARFLPSCAILYL